MRDREKSVETIPEKRQDMPATPSLAGTAETMTLDTIRAVWKRHNLIAFPISKRAWDELDAAIRADERARLAGALADSARLDRLAEWAATPLELDRMGGLEGDEPVGPMFLTFESPEVTQYSAPTLREVIDKVEAAIQATAARPHATPEGE